MNKMSGLDIAIIIAVMLNAAVLAFSFTVKDTVRDHSPDEIEQIYVYLISSRKYDFEEAQLNEENETIRLRVRNEALLEKTKEQLAEDRLDLDFIDLDVKDVLILQ